MPISKLIVMMDMSVEFLQLHSLQFRDKLLPASTVDKKDITRMNAFKIPSRIKTFKKYKCDTANAALAEPVEEEVAIQFQLCFIFDIKLCGDVEILI